MGKGTSYEGPSQSTSHSSSWSGWGGPSDRWRADTPGWRQGSFQAGERAAVGIAFVASRSTAGPPYTYKYNWWWEVIGLQCEINEDAIIDEEFRKCFEEQTVFLEYLEKQVHDAVDRAKGRIAKMGPGKSMRDVFGPAPPKQSPAAQGGGG